MPTQTFFNLPEEKKERLLCAIREELFRVPYEEVSINKIVKRADISRGSFYQYFTGKDDLFQFIASSFAEKTEAETKALLQKHRGDPFAMLEELMRHIFDLVPTSTDVFVHFKNLLIGLKVKDFRDEGLPLAFAQEKAKDFLDLVDLTQINLQKEDDWKDMVDILATQLKWALVEYIHNPGQKDEILDRFCNKMAILKRGMALN